MSFEITLNACLKFSNQNVPCLSFKKLSFIFKMSDPTRRPLNFPTWHIPYLEKHRIYELFHEIAREMVVQKPADHVLFMKHILQNAAKSKDVSRTIILKSPRVNCLEIAIEIAKVTNQIVISENTLRCCLEKNLDECSPSMIAACLAYLVRTENAYSVGWIIVDCIRNENEAKELLHFGILPTHVIHLIAPFHPELSQLVYCRVISEWPQVRRHLIALREVFKTVLKEVHIGKRTLAEVVCECVQLSKIRKAVKAIRPRLVLLGPRGSGRKTQAKLLEENLNIVHVDFERLICRAWMAETELGAKLRACRREVCFHSELLSQVVNKRLLEEDCLKKGWVLTGYPYTTTDFKFIDGFDTPPNRVIFLECDLNVCKERLRYRKMNVYSGSVTNVDMDLPNAEEKILKQHPKDNEGMIDAELNFYCQNYGLLRRYCGGTGCVVNGDQNERWVYECIVAILFKAPPPAPPRKGFADTSSDDTTSSSSSSFTCDCVSIPNKVIDCYVTRV